MTVSVPISQLPSATQPLEGSEIIVMNQNGITATTELSAIKSYSNPDYPPMVVTEDSEFVGIGLATLSSIAISRTILPDSTVNTIILPIGVESDLGRSLRIYAATAPVVVGIGIGPGIYTTIGTVSAYDTREFHAYKWSYSQLQWTLAFASSTQGVLAEGSVQSSQITTTGEADKIQQLDSDRNFNLSSRTSFSNDMAGVTRSIILPCVTDGGSSARLWWPNLSGTDGASILYSDGHSGLPELQINGDRVALCTNNHGTIQLGLSRSWNSTQSVLLQQRGDSTSDHTTVGSSKLHFGSTYWNGSASVQAPSPYIQAVPDGTTGNVFLEFINSSTIPNNTGTDSTGPVVMRLSKDGLWELGKSVAPISLTDNGTTTVTQSCSIYKDRQVGKITLTGDRVLIITGAITGMKGVIYVTQDITGSRSLTLPTGSITESGFSLTTGLSSGEKCDRLEWEYEAPNFFWTIKKGFDVAYTPSDSDAADYIIAVETAIGAAIASGKKQAIDTFIQSEKAASRWMAHKRLFLPIWSNASANSIDMKTLNVGTMIGSPTHTEGYIEFDGVSSAFDTDAIPSTIGLALSSAGYTILRPTNYSANYIRTFGVNTGSTVLWDYLEPSQSSWQIGDSTLRYPLVNSDRVGIFCNNRVNTEMATYRLKSSGFSTLSASTVAESGSIPSTYSVYVGGINSAGSAGGYSNTRVGAFCMHSGFEESDATEFSNNLKLLWETCTGLTLP